ncbi:endothelin-converting enzyme [Sphingomonas aurantiaca]|jgi:putative endopeptidase|uniref:Endothelin-converting enzyme n=1 Tax=Sphingomonas aurantiaca TaxID=185949 RepID=A0A2T5GNL2_9SPHN|nr:M13-type metalloendopeptidase [Sphingomonas aurantiaca]PTQ60916.1 endothelin-converting enzyme [Sphingomonas aurantiaca]
MRKSIVTVILLASAASAIAQTAPRTATPSSSTPAPATTNANKPQIGDFGFDMAGRDTSVTPGTDFFDYTNGGWVKTTPIPADRSSYGMFHVLQDLSLARTRTILDAAATKPGDKVGDFYTSFMDEAGANAKGAAPVKPMLAALRATKDKTALVTEIARLQRQGVGGLVGVGVQQDDKDPTTYVVGLGQSGLGLPDRDYYLKDDAKLATIRTAYQAYLTRMLTLAGEPNAAARAAAVFNMEKGLATAHWTRIESRDADKTYNKWTAADFAAKAPGFPWAQYMTAMGVSGRPFYLVAQPTAFTGEAKVFADTPLAVLQDYAMLKVLRAYAPYLSSDFDKTNFGFYGTTLSGTPEQQVRWKRGVSTVSGAMGEAIGQQYVAKYFPPASKAAADDLVKNVIAAMGERLKNLEWMAPETKTKALAKLAAFTPKIGYPDKWRDYSALQIQRGDLVGNVSRANAFDYDRDLKKLGQPIDRAEWFMTPMTINAYANPTMNEVVFPAAILQAPFFDPKADPAVNYGGIGAVIGHEISHHFDDQGRKYDLNGKLTDWWTAQDVARFKVFTDALVKQYDAYEPLPGQHIQGGLTLGENIADLAGLTVAYDAYHKSLGGKPAPIIDGTTGDQRFYYGWAGVWRTKFRDAALQQALLSDPHSPGHQRVLTVRNLDPWYAAFGAKPGEASYLAPANRVRIW